MSTFPSVISTISDPAATNKLNAPSHSTIETNQNDAIKKLETFIGTAASAVGTLMYDIRGAGSDGGGHIQGANKGGTGQTAYTKGDVLVASSSSVLSKLAVGTNDQALVADSTQSAGIKWGGVATATNIQNQTYTYVRGSVMSGSVFGVVLSQTPSVLSDGLGLVVKFPAAPLSSLMALQVFTQSGSLAALIKKTDLTNPDTTDIVASMIGVLEFDSVSSVFQIVNIVPGASNKMTLLRANSGTSTSSVATTLDSIATGTPTAKDTVIVYYSIQATGAQEALLSLIETAATSNIMQLHNNAVLATGNACYGMVVIRNGAGGTQDFVSQDMGTAGASQVSSASVLTAGKVNMQYTSFLVNWVSNWTLGLRQGGVSPGGTLYWNWAVYKLVGQ